MKSSLSLLIFSLLVSISAQARTGRETVVICRQANGGNLEVGIARGDFGIDFETFVVVSDQRDRKSLVVHSLVKKNYVSGDAVYTNAEGKLRLTVNGNASKADLFIARAIVQPVDLKDLECETDPTKNAIWWDDTTLW